MANHRKRGEPGRFCKDGPEVRAWPINVRCTQAEHHAYLTAGGADWLRSQLAAEITRQRLAPTPTANNTFPAFIVTDAKTGEPVSHTVTAREF